MVSINNKYYTLDEYSYSYGNYSIGYDKTFSEDYTVSIDNSDGDTYYVYYNHCTHNLMATCNKNKKSYKKLTRYDIMDFND